MAASTHYRHPRPLCRVCERPLPLNRCIIFSDAHRFCSEHWSQYKTRQSEGVAAQNLNPDWSDTLANWRERPAELDEEARIKRHRATPLYFREKYEDWLLFMRHYISGGIIDLPQTLRLRGISSLLPRKNRNFVTLRTGKRSFVDKILYGTRERREHRASDCLAVNPQTGEIRRFVDVQSETVLDDLQGIRPAPYQEELASFWGKSEPAGIQERFRSQYMDKRHRVRIPDLVHLAAFPVYGITDQVSDFSVSGLGTSGGVWGGIKGISFHFSSPRYPQEHEHFDVSSSEPRQPNIVYHPEIAATSLFMHSGLNEAERA